VAPGGASGYGLGVGGLFASIAILACVEQGAEVVEVAGAAAEAGLADPTVLTPAAAAEGPYACAAPLGTPLDGGFTQAVAADADSLLVGAEDVPVRTHMVLGADAAHEIFLVWETLEGTVGGRAQIGFAEDGLSWTIPGVSYPVAGVRIHVARVCGLASERAWHYRVGSDNGWSPVGSFSTAPEAGVDAPLRVAVLGDSRNGPEAFASLFADIRAAGVEHVMFTGDAVGNGTNWAEWEEWFDAGGEAFLHVPLVFAPGNHEANDLYYFALFPSHTGLGHQAVNVGPIHWSVVNDNQNSGVSIQSEAEWLAADLASATAPWVIPAWHRPAVAACQPHGEDATNRTVLLPVVDAEPKVRLVVNGHNHNYERSSPYRGGEVVEGGIVHLTSGGGGAPLYTGSYGYTYSALQVKTQHWVLLEADARSLNATAYDLAGNTIDSFTILR
jgi:hypothetical protein